MSDTLTREPLWPYLDRWDCASLDVADVAELLNLKPTTVRQALLDSASGFPSPSARGANGRNLWTPRAVYTHILDRRPQQRTQIPRLFTAATELNPGQFLYARTILLRPTRSDGQPQRLVVHVWRPSDGRGPIAIAYPLLNADGNLAMPTRMAAGQLLKELTPDVEAIAIPTDETAAIRRPDHDDIVYQPAMWVCDPSCPDSGQARHCGWYEIANLIRRDLPWWPTVLRDEQAMLAWQPSDPPQRIAAAHGTYSAQPLLDLITADTKPALRDIITNEARKISTKLAASAAHEADLYPEHPGLVHAAVPDCEPNASQTPPTRADTALLLHHRVGDHNVAARALAAWRTDPVITAVITIDADLVAKYPAATQWSDRLVEVPTDRRDELGFHQLRRLWPNPATVPTTVTTAWYAHRDDPDTWAVRTQDGTIYTTVGSAVPAGGHLRSAIITDKAALFTTDAGVTWPLPHGIGRGYCAGYAGTGPAFLAEALTLLAHDAGADVDGAGDLTIDVESGLWELIRTHPLPLMLADIGNASPWR